MTLYAGFQRHILNSGPIQSAEDGQEEDVEATEGRADDDPRDVGV